MEAGQQLSALSHNNSGKRMTEYRVLNPGNTDPDMAHRRASGSLEHPCIIHGLLMGVCIDFTVSSAFLGNYNPKTKELVCFSRA